MNSKNQVYERRRAYDKPFAWHWGGIDEEIEIKGKTEKHPGRKTVIFLVHGIGKQDQAESAANLRSGIEDAYREIADWQNGIKDKKEDNEEKEWLNSLPNLRDLPPPYISEGYWADYPEIEKNFKKDCEKFRKNEISFFKKLWKIRLFSVMGTYFWFLIQQIKLLNPKVIFDVGLLSWFTYFPLQINSFVALTFLLFKKKSIITDFLTDVRLYLKPKGIIENAIVQRIDRRVGDKFLELIGLDWDFKSLPRNKQKEVVGKRVVFDRVVWVAHSLGSVISYNVLSDLFQRIEEIKKDPECTDNQLEGIAKFKKSLRRFVTIGSPIDKIAYLFKGQVLRKWHTNDRKSLLNGGEDSDDRLNNNQDESKKGMNREWWFNYYHVLDPVSGALDNKDLFGTKPPINRHIWWCYLPGWAHVAYWKDSRTLRFILTRAYGSVMWDEAEKPYSSWLLTTISIVVQFLQSLIALGLVYVIVYWIVNFNYSDFFNEMLNKLLFNHS